MRFFEFDEPEAVAPEAQTESIANLLTVLNVVVGRAEDEDAHASISTPALINMVKNTGVQFDYDSLVAAYEKNSAVKNIIKSFNAETVELAGGPADVDVADGAGEDSGAAIERIAKRVAKRSIG